MVNGSQPGALPAGVVFDCDGTIADTESLSDRAWTMTLAEHGYRATPEDFRTVIGRPFQENWAYFAARAELGSMERFRARLRTRFERLVATELEIYDDVASTMRVLGEAGLPIAVASSSGHAHVLRVLEHGGLADVVHAVIGVEDVTRHKPDPEPYTAAARRLGLDPARCSAVEDTPVGVASATAAGMYTVAVVRVHASAAELQAAHRVVTSVTPEVLVAGGDRGQMS